jgi:hypothetical protein
MNVDLEAIDGLCTKIIEQRDRIEQLETSLAEWKALAIQWAKDNDQNSPSPLQAPHNPGERLRNSDVAAGEGETPPARQENDDVFPGFRGNNEA